MTSSQLELGHLVRRWAERVVPDEPAVAVKAAGVAVRAHSAGASIGEACLQAQSFVECWARHPSNRRPSGAGLRPLAS